MAGLPVPTPEMQAMLDRVTLKALARAETILDHSTDSRLIEVAMKLVLDRRLPVPKVDSAARGPTLLVSSATAHMEIMGKKPKPIETVTVIEDQTDAEPT